MKRRPSNRIFKNVDDFAARLRDLHEQRNNRDNFGPRKALTKGQRADILTKTGRRCHICGGRVTGDDWQADHVLAHGVGGASTLENYLPAHSVCNRSRWFYSAEEIQWILSIGVFMRTQIEKKTTIGREAGEKFLASRPRVAPIHTGGMRLKLVRS